MRLKTKHLLFCGIFIGGFILLLLIQLSLFENNKGEYVTAIGQGAFLPSAILQNGQTISQTFQSERDISGISLLVATYMQTFEDITFNVSIYDEHENLLGFTYVDFPEVHDNSWLRFSFSEPIYSESGFYRVVFIPENIGSFEPLVVWLCTNSFVSAYLNGIEQPGSLNLELFSYESFFDTDYWVAVLIYLIYAPVLLYFIIYKLSVFYRSGEIKMPIYLSIAALFLAIALYLAITFPLGTITIVSRSVLVLFFLLFMFLFISKKIDNNRIFGFFAGAIIVLSCVTNIVMLSSIGHAEQVTILSRHILLGYVPPTWYSLGNIRGTGNIFETFSRHFGNLDMINSDIMRSVFTSNLWIFFIGFGLYLLSINKNFPEYWVYISYPLGTLALIPYVSLLLFLGVNINTLTLFYLPTAIIVLFILIKANGLMRYIQINFINLIPKIAISITVILLFSYVPTTALSPDSMDSLIMSSVIAEDGLLTNRVNFNSSHFITRGFLTSIMSLFTYLRSVPFFNFAHQPIFTVTCCMLIFSWVFKKSNFSKSAIALYGIFFSFIAMPMVLVHSIWLLNNLSIGLFLTISLIFYYEYSENSTKVNLILMILFLTVASIIRIEGFIFLAVIMVCLFQSNIQKTELQKIFIFLFLISVLWSLGLYVFAAGNHSETFWNPRNATLQVLLVGSVMLYYCFRDKFRVPYVYGKEALVMILFFIVAIVITFVLDIGYARVNYNALFYTHFVLGYWNLFVLSVLVLLVGGFATGNIKQKHFTLISILASYALAIYATSILRDHPYNMMVGDSGLRMLLHIAPATFVVIAQVVTEFLNKENIVLYENTKG